VLEHFLSMPAVFKTGYFTGALEAAARHNLQQEKILLQQQLQ
jgi:predicted metal-dependent HD superfamily phosphohydrolase